MYMNTKVNLNHLPEDLFILSKARVTEKRSVRPLAL